MSRIDRTGNPFTVTLRRRLLAGAIAAAALTGLSAHPVFAQDIVVSGGAVQSNSSPATYTSLTVSGTDGSGNPSTYNADAPLTLTGRLLDVDRGGVFNANANVSLVNASSFYGVINLNTGTMTSQSLGFVGADSVTRSAGNYSTNNLTLIDGATLSYGSGDSITNSVDVDLLASLTLNQNLTLSSYLRLFDGGSITRTSETISALAFGVNGARFDLLGGDTWSMGHTSTVRAGAFVNAPQGATLGRLIVGDAYEDENYSRFNVNGDVSLVNASAYGLTGVIKLNTGTLTASEGLSFDFGSVTRSAGNYSTNSLTLFNRASLGYIAGDSITGSVSLASGATLTLAKDLNVSGGITVDGAATSLASAGQAISANSLSLNNSATVTLDRNLTLSGYLILQNGGAIARTSEVISALAFSVDNATLDLLAGDTFSPGSSSNVQNGALVNAPAGTSIGYLNVSGTNGNGDRATFNVNGDVSLVNGSASAYSDGVINLNTGTLSASQGLSFDGVGSVTRSAGSYSTNSLTLGNGASLGYDAGDTITSSVSLASGGALTLAKDLNVSGGITVDGAATSLVSAGQAISAGSLSVSNGANFTLDQNLTLSSYLDLTNGGSISRTSETISTPAFFVNNATLDLLAGDTFSPGSSSYVQNGALVNAPAGTSLGSLIVTGTNGNGDRATFNANGDVTVNGSASAYSDGVINMIAGTLSTPKLSLDGVGSAEQAGGHYDVTDLFLSGGATLSFGVLDSIDALSVDGAGSLLNAFDSLTLSSLSLTNGGGLYLGGFTVGDAISNWGLRMSGDETSFLQGLIGGGLLTAGDSPLSVIFDADSNMTYVTFVSAAVPEIDPNTAHGAVMLLGGALGLLERRLRRAALARHAA